MGTVRIMFAGDLHKRSKDITTIEGYVECTYAVQRSLMHDIEELGIDYFVSLGDWYDKGYAVDIAASLADYDIDIELAKLLDGKFYGLIGNHIRLGMDSNPELHIIQPHPIYKSRRNTMRQEQIMKTPDMLRIGDVQLSFMHHNKDAEDVKVYKAHRESWAKYHIALFHTPMIIPASMLAGTTFGYSASSSESIGYALEGVDLAIVGDIHLPLGKFVVHRNGGDTVMIVPGSLTNTDAGEGSRHTSIDIPIVDIRDDSSVSLSMHWFDLKTNMLTFKRKNVENAKDKLKTLRGKAVQELHSPEEVVAYLGNPDMARMSLNAFMEAHGYTSMDKMLIRSILNDPENIENLIRIYKDEGEVEL